MSNWVIAIAACVTSLVYWLISGQIAEQIKLAKEQSELTRNLFLESHAPALSVSLERFEFVASTEQLNGRIVIRNHGTAIAREIEMTITFGGTNDSNRTYRVAVQPSSKLIYPFSLNMTAERFRTSRIKGNHLEAYLHGSYKGLTGTEYAYEEKQEFYPELGRFMPFWAA